MVCEFCCRGTGLGAGLVFLPLRWLRALSGQNGVLIMVRMMRNRFSLAAYLAIMLLNGCLTHSADSLPVRVGFAPESVEGREVCIVSESGEVSKFCFSSGNTSILSKEIRPGYGNLIRYRRTGSNSASIEVEEWEFVYKYTLHFTSPSAGTATESGYGEGTEWNNSGIHFQIK